MCTSPFLEEDLCLSTSEGGLMSVHLSLTANSRTSGTPAGIFSLGLEGRLDSEMNTVELGGQRFTVTS